ncbi:MAG: nicotinate (nicotinamide) nucleotide adenylyltransferase [Chlorobiaceae bacterium]|nr:nicotinate (nicotinamide) nucleotide adenylyltransferase [Chlorobiaceae bacterium]
MRTGIFGASFDPPHNGHLALCLFGREMLGLDRLIVSVSKNPFKKSFCAAEEDRIAMTRLFVSELNLAGRFAETSTWEIEQPGVSWTVELLRNLRARCGDDELVLLAGEDSYRQMPRWREPLAITSLCTIAVFGRSGFITDSAVCGEPFPPAQLFDFDLPVSATEIRRRLSAGQSIAQLVPASIAAYISARNLYRGDALQ